MNIYQDRIISSAWDRTRKLRARLGGSPVVSGLCPLRDSCDVCRAARKASAAYAEHTDIEGYINLVVFGRIKANSWNESEVPYMTSAERDAFYARFSTKFDELLDIASRRVDAYRAKYGFVATNQNYSDSLLENVD